MHFGISGGEDRVEVCVTLGSGEATVEARLIAGDWYAITNNDIRDQRAWIGTRRLQIEEVVKRTLRRANNVARRKEPA